MASHVTTDRNSVERDAALRFLFGRIDYERARNVPYRRSEFKLQRMRELLDRLENPQQALPIVHVAGTKGKGSTAAMIGAVLSAAGYRTGVFTSPHLDRIEQRMAIAGRPCSAEELVDLVDRVRPAVEAMDAVAAGKPGEIGPTYFEITNAMALLHFARRKVHAAVLEVGLGGRLDSTNVCLPRVAVITSISFDHTKQLGNTLESIAREKAGIVKPGVPLVSGVTEAGPREVIRQIARWRGCRLVELGANFDFEYRPPRHLERGPARGELDFRYFADRVVSQTAEAIASRAADGFASDNRVSCRRLAYDGLPLELLGRHQAANAAVALASLAELERSGWAIPEEAVRTGLAAVDCRARVEVIARRPVVVVDAAHNPASIEALIQTLDESFVVRRRLLIFATTAEKDIRGMLGRLLGRFDEVVFTRYLNNPRAVPPEESAALARELTGRRYPTGSEPADAWETICRLAAPEDLVCVTGSFFIAAEIRRRLAGRPLPLPAQAEGAENLPSPS